jgi:hypothetical protein
MKLEKRETILKLELFIIMSSLFLGTNIKSKPKQEFRTKIQNSF